MEDVSVDADGGRGGEVAISFASLITFVTSVYKGDEGMLESQNTSETRAG